MPLDRKSSKDKERVLRICRTFLRIAASETGDLGSDLHYSSLAAQLAVQISRAHNTLFVLQSACGVEFRVPMGNCYKTEYVTLVGLNLKHRDKPF